MHALRAFRPLFLIALAGAARAGDVDVVVTDAAGKPLAGAVVTLESTGAALSVRPLALVEVGQTKRQFAPQVTVVTVGTPVVFPNFDTVRHHVYSFSPARTFELKLYAGVPNAPVVFDKPGIVTMGCNIHDRMAGWIVVVDTPLHGISAPATGRAHLAGVAAGSYRLRIWHPGLAATATAAQLPVQVGSGTLEQAVQLEVAVNPLGPQS